jgi:phage-related protein
MDNKYYALFLDDVRNFIGTLPNEDQGKINATVVAMESGDFESSYIKTLKTPIKELIIKRYRLIFFIYQNTIYFIGVFIKKSAKTPKKEIENAEKIYKMMIEKL